MAEAKLVPVGSKRPDASSDEEEPRDRPAKAPGGRRALFAIAALLVLAVVALGIQTWRADRLTGQVETLSGEILELRGALVAHESHLEDVRDSVGEVREELARVDALVASLEELARRDPAATAP